MFSPFNNRKRLVERRLCGQSPLCSSFGCIDSTADMLAQLVEHLLIIQQVTGSNLGWTNTHIVLK